MIYEIYRGNPEETRTEEKNLFDSKAKISHRHMDIDKCRLADHKTLYT